MSRNPPTWSRSLIPNDNEPFVDNQYTRSELESMDWQTIRRIAAQVDSDEISGQSDREAMEEFLVGHERVSIDD